MKYVVTDSSITIFLDGQVKNLSAKSTFNFKKLHKLLSSGDFTESQVKELLKPPEKIEGYFTVHQILIAQNSVLIVVDETNESRWCQIQDLRHNKFNPAHGRVTESAILSIHPSIADVVNDYPEHFL